jgi:hypothetical protein
MVQVGDSVELIGQRNEETAQLFGAPSDAGQPAAIVAQTMAGAASIAGTR